MLKRIKRAGVWLLAMSMAVTMTPAAAFATDAGAPEGADVTEQDPVVQADGEVPDGSEGEAPAADLTTQDGGSFIVVGPGENDSEDQEPMLDAKFGITMWNSAVPFAPAAYGEVRSYGDKNWKTGTSPKLQPAEDQTLDESYVTREYAFFRNMPTLIWAIWQDRFGDMFSEKAVEVTADNDNDGNDVEEPAGIEFEKSAAGMTDPGYVLERITPDDPDDWTVYAIHMTTVDVTVKADDASKILDSSKYVPDPIFTVTETIGDYPEELDMQMKMNHGQIGGNVTVEREPGKPLSPMDEEGTVKLLPVLNDNITRWNEDKELTGVLWYSVINHVVATEENGVIQDEEIDLVNNGMMMGGFEPVPSGPIRPVNPPFEELLGTLNAAGVEDAAESGDVEDYAEAIGAMSKEEAFDMSKISDPPLHVVLGHGTLYIYDDEDPLPAKEGHVAKQMEATQLDSQYKTTVKMTLPLAEGIDPEEYYKTSGQFGYGPAKLVSKAVKAADESLETQGRVPSFLNPLRFPKQFDTITPYSTSVLELSSDFTLPVNAEGELDLSKLSLVDYRYYYEPEEEPEEEPLLLKASGYYDDVDDEFYDTYQEYYDANKAKIDKYVLNKALSKDKNDYYVRDLKGYKLDLESMRAEAEEEDEAEPLPPMELYGFGLDLYVVDDDDENEIYPKDDGDEASVYDIEDFEYMVMYLPEGIGVLSEDEDFMDGFPYGTEVLEKPCIMITNLDNAMLNPLHYFTFQFEETLNDVSNAAGTHGSYDQYGKAERSDIKVLDKATLYRMSIMNMFYERPVIGPELPPIFVEPIELRTSDDYDSRGIMEKPEEFFIPTVSYTINGGGGSSGGRSSGGLTIMEPQVPLAELPELNKKDHVAYVIGYEDGTVRPENLITRAEVSTIFFRLLTDDSRRAIWSSNNSYKDTAAGAWYNNAVSTLSNGGVLSGYTDGTFLPSGNITRAEFATIAARFDESSVSTANISFTDISGHWAENNIKRAAALGYITGYQDGSFKPNAPITRAEAMTLMNRVLGRDKISAAGLLDNMAKWSDNPTSAWYYVAVQEATNSHDYTITDGVETWTSILPNRDWAALEKEWATGAERGAEVFQPVEEETPAAETEEPAAEETPAAEFEAGSGAEA